MKEDVLIKSVNIIFYICMFIYIFSNEFPNIYTSYWYLALFVIVAISLILISSLEEVNSTHKKYKIVILFTIQVSSYFSVIFSNYIYIKKHLMVALLGILFLLSQIIIKTLYKRSWV